ASTTWAEISRKPSSKTWNRPAGPAPMISASVWMGAAIADGNAGEGSADQLADLVGLVLPLVRVGQRRLALGDAGPGLGQVGVDLDERELMGRHVFLGKG